MLSQFATYQVQTLRHLSLEMDISANGGAILAIRSGTNGVNPLDFHMSRHAADSNEAFQGHFICCPRWGEPDQQERAKGLKKHGDICNLEWEFASVDKDIVVMNVNSSEESVEIHRTIRSLENSPGWKISEVLRNTSSNRRAVNIVQHPTLAGIFLHEKTRIDCSAREAVKDLGDGCLPAPAGEWPYVGLNSDAVDDLRFSNLQDSAVYSFRASDTELAWITAFDPLSKWAIGYVWKTACYPWLHHWIHVDADRVRYRGIEFGTAAWHQSVSFIKQTGTSLINGLPAWNEMGSGETQERNYYVFMIEALQEATGVKTVEMHGEKIRIRWHGVDKETYIEQNEGT